MYNNIKLKLMFTTKKMISWLIFIDCVLLVFCCKSFSQIKENQAALLQSQIQFESSQRRTKQLLGQAEKIFSQEGQSFQQITRLFENPWDDNKFLNNLAAMSEKNNIYLLSIQPLEMKKINGLQVLPFEAKGSGDYFAVITWLKFLKKLNAPVIFNSISMSSAISDTKNLGVIQFDIVFDILKL